MLKLYEIDGGLRWYEPGKQPARAVEVKKRRKTQNKQAKPKSK